MHINILRNVHFWIIFLIVIFLGYAYYDWYNRFEWFWWFSIYEGFNNLTGSLFVIPLIYGAILFRFRGALTFWTISFLIILPRIIFLSYDINALVSNIVIALLPLTCIGIITLELEWRNRQKRMMELREQERENFMTEIFRVQENERQRIALELHDSCIQELIAVANSANDFKSFYLDKSSEQIHKNATWIRDTVMRVSEELRRISLDLRPSLLDNLGLISAVRWLVSRLGKDSDIAMKVTVKGERRDLNAEVEATLFRIIQEALNNVKRHSEATEAAVLIEFKPDTITINVKDNGKGFEKDNLDNYNEDKSKLGIQSMEHRAKSLNSNLIIRSAPGKGTSVKLITSIA